MALDAHTLDYFLFNGLPTGYQYELAQGFCRDLGVRLRVYAVSSPAEAFSALEAGEADFYAPSEYFDTLPSSFLLSAQCGPDCLGLNPNKGTCAIEGARRWVFVSDYPDLLFLANSWLEKQRGSNAMLRLRAKFGKQGYMQLHLAKQESSLSKYDELIQNATEGTQWDWRLLASLIYQESRFKEGLYSPRGAFGLMQFTPSTARYFGISHRAAPEEQIPAAVQYFEWLDKGFAQLGVPAEQRPDFILASYNAGYQKIVKARKRAEGMGLSPNVWAGNVALAVSKRQITAEQLAQDGEAIFGYGETCAFVKQIRQRYADYCNLVN